MLLAIRPAAAFDRLIMANPRLAPAQPAIGESLSPGLQCRQAVRAAERAAAMPDQLMAAIAMVESGRTDAQGGQHPWPWTINAEGNGQVFNTKAEAIAAVRALQASGVRSIDVGCMQVNLMYHPDAFGSLEQAFDPAANAAYAARFLTRLYAQTGSWPRATAAYHSATPERGEAYQRKVAANLPAEQARARSGIDGAAPNIWAARGGPMAAGAAGGGFMLSNHADTARLLPAAQGVTGRGLAAYRAAPIPVAGRRG